MLKIAPLATVAVLTVIFTLTGRPSTALAAVDDGTATPAPAQAAPSTPAPSTPAPSTPAPSTPTPSSLAPSAPTPSSPSPSTPTPSSPVPSTPTPSAPVGPADRGAADAATAAPLAQTPQPARLAAPAGISDYAALVAAIDCTGTSTITLTGDISENTGDGALTIGCNLTLDLSGHALTTNSIIIAGGKTFTIEDTGTGGTLTATARTDGQAGIQTTGATLNINGGTIVASVGASSYSGAAGIGGGSSGDGGTITITGGTINAAGGGLGGGAGIGAGAAGGGGTITITGGTINASSAFGAGIGAGGGTVTINGGTIKATSYGGAGINGGTIAINGGTIKATAGNFGTGITGGFIDIGAGADVTASGGATAVGNGAMFSDFGSLTLEGTLYVPSGSLVIPNSNADGAEVIISKTGKLLGSATDPTTGATITGSGQITNNGVIGLAASHVQVAVTGNNYLVSFDTHGGTDPAPIQLFSPSFADSGLTLPTGRWATTDDGTGTWFTGHTALAPPTTTSAPTRITVYAQSGLPALVLDTAAGTCTDGGTITLTEDISQNTGDGALTIGCNLTLDLSGHALTTNSIIIAGGKTFTIEDTGTGGTLTATARTDGQAGIRTSGAFLIINSGTVTATGGTQGAGIGDDQSIGGYGGYVTIAGGTITAAGEVGIGGTLIQITGGTVTANGSDNAGIGGVGGGGGYVWITGGTIIANSGDAGISGFQIFIGADAVVSASGGATALGFDEYGTLTLEGTMYVPSGSLVIPNTNGDFAEVVIAETGKLLGSAADPTMGATVTGDGQITNNGVIGLAASHVQTTVTGNNYLVSFDTHGGTDSAPVRVFATTLAAGYRTLPTSPTDTTWNTQPDGAGTWFTPTTPITTNTTLHAVTDASLTITPSANTVGQGHSLTFTVTGHDHDGHPVDTAHARLTSSVATDVITGLKVAFPHASPHIITATLGTATISITIQVAPARTNTNTNTNAPRTPVATADASHLAATGSNIGITATLALLLLGTGLLVFITTRRRNTRNRPA